MNPIQFFKFYLPLIFVCLLVQIGKSQVVESIVDSTANPYDFVEQMPEFVGGAGSMMRFIQAQIKYPEEARKANIEGTVILYFNVSESGKLTDIKVVRGIGHGCDEEAVRVVSIMPDWTPGKHNNKNVPVNFTLPIKFKL
ncbi:MAG: energy transducer TonB [Saprospiraceae bacterium]|nr:energy transducer TonB [Saprospiraceae bacterium]MBK7809751.1 energy transducer TonB [Saprospiraceae bacterium]MBK9632138.1 energy transducer TonB [Saprospiraceae bacterium]